MKRMLDDRTQLNNTSLDRVPTGTFYGEDTVPAGSFHGGDEIPAGSFHLARA
jgi:hypothetical protein